jgi:hypothetical protein
VRRYPQLGTVARRNLVMTGGRTRPINASAGTTRPARRVSWRKKPVGAKEEWQVSCRDIASRRRDLTVFVSQGHIVINVPPGEAAVLTPLEVGRLRAALREAVVAASDTEM